MTCKTCKHWQYEQDMLDKAFVIMFGEPLLSMAVCGNNESHHWLTFMEPESTCDNYEERKGNMLSEDAQAYLTDVWGHENIHDLATDYMMASSIKENTFEAIGTELDQEIIEELERHYDVEYDESGVRVVDIQKKDFESGAAGALP